MITAAIIVIVMVLSLTITYRELVEARTDALLSRQKGLLGVLVQSGENGTRARVAALRVASRDPVLLRALATPGATPSARQDSDVAAALGKVAVATDSGLPVELWSADGRRIAHIGTDIRGDSIAALPPELRSRRGTRVSEVPVGTRPDSTIRVGALYPSSGHVYYWTVAPVMESGQRIGAIVQQRRIVSNPQVKQMIRDLSGEEFTVFLRNVTDDFSSSIDGRPVPPAVRRDTTDSGYVATRAGGGLQIGYEQRVRGTPYIFSLEAPKRTIVATPRATIRQLSLFSLLLLLGGVALTWALSRQITLPLVELTTATEAMAQGQYSRRVAHGHAASDEVERLGASFNRMASEVEASQLELASQVEEALATSEELERANEQLQLTSASADEARDAALDANRAKGDFLAVMSHELRTPLNAIGGYTEILQLGIYGEMNEAQQDALVRIARSQQTLLSLINDVLNFAKLEAGAVQYAVTDVPLAAALGVIEDFVSPQLRDKHMTYRLAPFDARATAHADADKLQQILINLLSNAVKYTPEGGEIDVRCELEERVARIHVVDTGIGIAPDRIEKVFDPFIQVGRALNRPHEGVGLGLSISRNLALAMGGSLTVESVQGKGSRFTLTIPRGADTTVPA